MNTIMILGSGYMGSGIAQVCANAGYEVLLWDLEASLIEKGIRNIAAGLDARIAKGKETIQHKNELLSHITATAELEDAAKADFVIEVVVENFEIKEKLLQELEQYVGEDTFIGTNTSYIPITRLAAGLQKPENFMGTHFFGPVPAMKLLEIVRGDKTSEAAVEAAKKLAVQIGKNPIVVQKDSPGFIVNRINAAIRMEAYRCYDEGIATIEDIDVAMRLGLNHPMGPFELNDLSGIDVGLAGLETLYQSFQDERWKPIPAAYERVQKKELGRKTGKGWYDYSSGEKKVRSELKNNIGEN